MTRFNSEKEFQTWFVKDLSSKGYYVRNIPDIGNVKKPFDLFACYRGNAYAFELKIDKDKTPSTPERIQKKLYPHQIANLIQFQSGEALGISRVVSYHMQSGLVYNYIITGEGNLIFKGTRDLNLKK